MVTADVRGRRRQHQVTGRYRGRAATAPRAACARWSTSHFPASPIPRCSGSPNSRCPIRSHRVREWRHRGRGSGQDPVWVHPDRAGRVRRGVDRPRADGGLHQRGGGSRIRRRRSDDGGRAGGQHPAGARSGAAVRGAEADDAFHLSRSAGRAVPASGGSCWPATQPICIRPVGVALSAGMVDAVNLAWKLAAAIDGWAPAGLLDTYHDERHLAAERTLLHTRAQVALRRGHDGPPTRCESSSWSWSSTSSHCDGSATLIARHRRALPMSGPNDNALTGTFAPDLTLPGAERRGTDALRPTGAARPHRPPGSPRSRPWLAGIASTSARARVDDRPADAVLIRPDAYVAWAAAIDEPTDTAAPALREALAYWCGTSVEATQRV